MPLHVATYEEVAIEKARRHRGQCSSITKCTDHCVNYFENNYLSLEKCVKSTEKNCKWSLTPYGKIP